MPIDNLTPARRMAIAAIMLGTVTGMGLLIAEMPTLTNTVGAGRIAGMGVAAGILLLVVLRLGLGAALEAKERTAGIVLLLIGLAGASTATLSHLNHSGGHAMAPEPVAVLDKQFKERTSKSPAQWKLHVRYREQDKWIDLPEAEWNRIEAGQTYNVRVIAGMLGYPVLVCPDSCR